jgi:hypothetical protein
LPHFLQHSGSIKVPSWQHVEQSISSSELIKGVENAVVAKKKTLKKNLDEENFIICLCFQIE